jgi:hypothetical protein
VLVLSVVNRLTVAAFASGEEIRISAPTHRPRLETEHASEAKSATGDITVSHPHKPLDTAELILTAIASVVQKLRECSAMSHNVP